MWHTVAIHTRKCIMAGARIDNRERIDDRKSHRNPAGHAGKVPSFQSTVRGAWYSDSRTCLCRLVSGRREPPHLFPHLLSFFLSFFWSRLSGRHCIVEPYGSGVERKRMLLTSSSFETMGSSVGSRQPLLCVVVFASEFESTQL